jgi:hypothetical protein
VLADGFNIALGDHASLVQHGNALGEIECNVHVVLYHQDGDLFRQAADHAHDAHDLGRRKPRGRLVQKQDLRLCRHGQDKV